MKIGSSEVERRLQGFKARAGEEGVKLTHQRLEIFREVAASLKHPDAEEIFRAVHPKMPTVSIDTVYRTLWLLHGLGLVNTLGPRRQSVRFDANVKDHHHFICVRCGLVRDFESAQLSEAGIPSAAKRLGAVLRTQVEFSGICRRCARTAARRPGLSNRKQQKDGGRMT